MNDTDPEAPVRGVVIDVAHRGCFRASVQSRGDSPEGGVVDNHWFTHFGMAYELLQLRAPGTRPRITVFAPVETDHVGREGDGNEVVVATEVEFLPQRLRITLA